MSRQLNKAAADTPDDYCVSCGAGVFDMGKPEAQLTHSSAIAGAESMTVCGLCNKLEIMLIRDSGTKTHPERLASYERRSVP